MEFSQSENCRPLLNFSLPAEIELTTVGFFRQKGTGSGVGKLSGRAKKQQKNAVFWTKFGTSRLVWPFADPKNAKISAEIWHVSLKRTFQSAKKRKVHTGVEKLHFWKSVTF